MRGINDDEVDAGFAKRSNAIQGVRRGSDRGANAQPAAIVLRSAREFRRFLEVLHRDHADELVIAVHHQHLLDAVLVQEGQHLFLRRVLADRDQPLLAVS